MSEVPHSVRVNWMSWKDRYSERCEVKEAGQGQGGAAVNVRVEVPVKVQLEPVRIQRATAEVDPLRIEMRVVTHYSLAVYQVLVEDVQSPGPCLGSFVSVE